MRWMLLGMGLRHHRHRPFYPRRRQDIQRGIALPEVLIAAVIAASVVTATSIGIANTARLLNNVTQLNQALSSP